MIDVQVHMVLPMTCTMARMMNGFIIFTRDSTFQSVRAGFHSIVHMRLCWRFFSLGDSGAACLAELAAEVAPKSKSVASLDGYVCVVLEIRVVIGSLNVHVDFPHQFVTFAAQRQKFVCLEGASCFLRARTYRKLGNKEANKR